jgi:hypothetical protein
MNGHSIIETYITGIRPRANNELNWFKQQASLSDAIRLGGLAINSKGKKYSHQWRLSKEVLKQARDLLLAKEKEIARCNSFHDLFLLLEALLTPIKGLGELYVYDTALRIGANLGLLPAKVYLHAGTRGGAKALGFHGKAKWLEVSELPNWLHQLEPHEIEDVLCIFKDRLAKKESKIEAQDLLKPSWCD